MHPAYEIILFTTASGAGYGLLAALGAAAACGVPLTRETGLIALALAMTLVTLGLGSSTLHLGRPERAWRALSQWRSSWLSREGVSALAAYPIAGLFALAWIAPAPRAVLIASALLAALAAIVTVACTGMIYQSLKPIPAWRQRWTTPAYLALAGFSGVQLLLAIVLTAGGRSAPLAAGALALAAVAAAIKFAYWRGVDAAKGTRSLGAATGLGRFGGVRLLDAPHTQANFVMREMGYAIARKHSQKLRRLAALLLFAAPAALTVLSAWAPSPAFLCAIAAIVSVADGLGLERWLFFAEATHYAAIYYDAAGAATQTGRRG